MSILHINVPFATMFSCLLMAGATQVLRQGDAIANEQIFFVLRAVPEVRSGSEKERSITHLESQPSLLGNIPDRAKNKIK